MTQIYSEGSPWFWKIFGSTILGFVAILLMSHLNNLGNTFDRTFFDLRSDIKEMRQILDAHKDRLAALEQAGAKEQGAIRDRLAVVEKLLAGLATLSEEQKVRFAAMETGIAAGRDEFKSLREWNKEVGKQVQEMREKVAELAAKVNKPEPPRP